MGSTIYIPWLREITKSSLNVFGAVNSEYLQDDFDDINNKRELTVEELCVYYNFRDKRWWQYRNLRQSVIKSNSDIDGYRFERDCTYELKEFEKTDRLNIFKGDDDDIDLSMYKVFPNTKEMQLSMFKTLDFTTFSYFTELERLTLHLFTYDENNKDGPFQDINFGELAKLPKLKSLAINFYMGMIQVAQILSLKNLEEIYILNTKIDDIGALNDHPTLKRIYLMENLKEMDQKIIEYLNYPNYKLLDDKFEVIFLKNFP